MSTDFANILGEEPAWKTCECGAQSSRVPCWECTVKQAAADAERQAWRAAEATFPKRFAWASLDAPELAQRVRVGEPLEAITQRVLAADRVIFAGPSGSGKTSLAIACLRRRLPDCMFVSALRLGTARIQHSAGDGEAWLVEQAIRARLLLIDEVGGEQQTATNAVRDVIFGRDEADLPTWITTGFRGAQLVEKYGDGALRRLTEGAVVVRLGAQP